MAVQAQCDPGLPPNYLQVSAGDGTPAVLSCPEGTAISTISFASYGTAADFTKLGYCHASTSRAVVEAACLGQSYCRVPADVRYLRLSHRPQTCERATHPTLDVAPLATHALARPSRCSSQRSAPTPTTWARPRSRTGPSRSRVRPIKRSAPSRLRRTEPPRASTPTTPRRGATHQPVSRPSRRRASASSRARSPPPKRTLVLPRLSLGTDGCA